MALLILYICRKDNPDSYYDFVNKIIDIFAFIKIILVQFVSSSIIFILLEITTNYPKLKSIKR